MTTDLFFFFGLVKNSVFRFLTLSSVKIYLWQGKLESIAFSMLHFLVLV